MVAPTKGSLLLLFTSPFTEEVVIWENSNGLANRVITNKKSILLSINFGFRLQRKGIFAN
jgi:hypothetical protein